MITLMAVSLDISICRQVLRLDDDGAPVNEWPISTSRYGPGERAGSYCTPRGQHIVRARIGGGLPVGAVLAGRRPTGEIHDADLASRHPGRDWILTRILWLSGTEVGRNRLGDVDTMRRYIYIHGTPDDQPVGVPASHGCIRMRNEHVVALFDQVAVGCAVRIGD